MLHSGPSSASVADAALDLFWRPRVLTPISSRRPIVLMYHAIAPGLGDYFGPDVFEEHVRFVKSRFHVIGSHECTKRRRATEDIDVLLSFDDGFLNNAVHVAPILKRHQVPAIFFISTRHCGGGLLWFAYLSALSRWFAEDSLKLDGRTFDMRPQERKRSVHELREYLLSLRPHPQAMYDKIERSLPSIDSFTPHAYLEDHYAGMTWNHIREIARDPLFEVGVHTVDHPFLTLCDDAEMERQMRENRVELERVTGKRISAIAYPGGDYDARVVATCMDLGFEQRYAVAIRRVTGDGRQRTKDAGRGTRDEGLGIDIPRIGIYKPSLNILGFKVQWGNILRRTPLRFG